MPARGVARKFGNRLAARASYAVPIAARGRHRDGRDGCDGCFSHIGVTADPSDLPLFGHSFGRTVATCGAFDRGPFAA